MSLPPTPTAAPQRIDLPEAAARRVVLLHAIETAPADDALWTAEDRLWATRLTRETAAAGTAPADWLDQRSRHALQRLAPRDPTLPRLLDTRIWRAGWVLLAAAVGLLAGVAVDAIGSGQGINLLAPPVWGVVLWNLVVYALLLAPRPSALQRWLARRLATRSLHAARPAGGVARHAGFAAFQLQWLRQAAPLLAARAALLLHVSAAALALGLIGGLYLRGLVLDYRAGWQSTFLDAEQVRAALASMLAPASLITGITVPDGAALQALRIGPGIAPTAGAAPWIHLYAATLAMAVVVPRLMLAALAAWRAGRLSRALPLALDPVYVQRLLRAQDGAGSGVRLVPHGQAPSPGALKRLQALLATELGEAAALQVLAPVAYGDEDDVPAGATSGPGDAQPPPVLQAVWVDLATTPEDEIHGRLLQTLRSAAPVVPLLLVADESAFRTRFAATPARVDERRAGWQRWAQAHGVGFIGIGTVTAEGADGGTSAHGVDGGADAAGRALRAALQS
ncbi:MAG: DUF2868 domain-containing protein [Rubrivivax sp.]